jgi:hypothetical protein
MSDPELAPYIEPSPFSVDIPAEVLAPNSESRVLTAEDVELRAMVTHLKVAKQNAVWNPDECEVVVIGALRPDRRLSNTDRDMDARVLRIIRRRFRIGLKD